MWGVGCEVWGVGCEVWGLGLGAWGLGFVVCGLWFEVWGLGGGFWGLWGGFWGSGFGFWGFRFRVDGVPLGGDEHWRQHSELHVASGRPGTQNRPARDAETLVICCQTFSVSAAHDCTPCRPLMRAFSGWIRSPPPTGVRCRRSAVCTTPEWLRETDALSTSDSTWLT